MKKYAQSALVFGLLGTAMATLVAMGASLSCPDLSSGNIPPVSNGWKLVKPDVFPIPSAFRLERYNDPAQTGTVSCLYSTGLGGFDVYYRRGIEGVVRPVDDPAWHSAGKVSVCQGNDVKSCLLTVV